MDSERFDAIAQCLASGSSRRGAVTAVAILAGTGFAGLDTVAARKRKRRNRKKPCKDLQDSCTRSRQCCGKRVCQLVPKICSEDGSKTCCSKIRGSCGNNCGCCGALRCAAENESRCCADAGGDCRAAADCCPDTGAFCNFQTGKCALV